MAGVKDLSFFDNSSKKLSISTLSKVGEEL
jgi:hypothetical protein